ncbi:hypothetical protein ACVST0_22765, partial [Yersinia enterocolitica]
MSKRFFSHSHLVSVAHYISNKVSGMIRPLQFGEALNQLHKIRDMMRDDRAKLADLTAAKLELSRMTGEIQQNSWRLEATPDEGGPAAAAQYMLPRIHYHLSGCNFALSGMASQLPVPVRVENEFGMSLVQYEKEFTVMQSALRDTGLLSRPEPAREFIYRGENVTVAIVQPDNYQHGAWLVRMQTTSLERENALEGVALEFPNLEGRAFLPGIVYGKAVLNSQTGKYEIGFRFLSGISEFHMYSSGHAEEANPTSADMLASSLSARVDGYLQELLKST